MREFLTAAEAAARLRVTPDAVRRWIAAGRLRASRTPGPRGRGRWRVAVEDVAAALVPGPDEMTPSAPPVHPEGPAPRCEEPARGSA